jgi:UDP-glucose 4-epimerase
MNVLVTGGAGYIGSHTAKALARAGHQPAVLEDLSTGHAHNVRWGSFVHAQLSDSATLRDVLRYYQIEAVVHFAAAARVLHWKPSWSSPETIVETAWRWHSAGRMVPTVAESTAVEGVIRA